MAVLSFIQGLASPSPPGMEVWDCCVYLMYVLFGLAILDGVSKSGRPVAHPDRKLGSNHKAAQANRVDILETLHGSKVDNFKGGPDEVRLALNADLDVSDVEKDPLRSPLLLNSTKGGTDSTEATITLSSGTRLTSSVIESLKKVSSAFASGELVDEITVFATVGQETLQTEVELQDGIFERLKNLLKLAKSSAAAPLRQEGTLTLQIDNWAILKPSDEGVGLLRLPVDKVPVILHAEYAAGLLTVTGLNLEDASILVSGQDTFFTALLKPLRFHKASTMSRWKGRQYWGRFSDTEEDIMYLPIRLSWKEIDDVLVSATKRVHLGGDGKSVEAVSKAVRVTDSLWKTVLRLWLPCVACWIFVIYNTRGFLRMLPFALSHVPNDLSKMLQSNGIIVSYVVIFISLLGSDRSVEFIKYHAETVIRGFGQALILVYCGFKSFEGPRLNFIVSGYGRLPPAPPSVKPPPPPPPSGMRSKVPPVDTASDKTVEDPDWEWPAFDNFEDKTGKIELRKCSEKVSDDVSPFQVMYCRRKLQLWPDLVQVNLLSSHLIKIVQKFLPRNGDLQSLAIPKVKGSDLFIVLDDLKSHERTTSSAYKLNDDKGGLHLKHLIRFMDTEYKDVSVRFQRMTKENSAAWDMLWTFLTPGKSVLYTCDHTQETLAAVVSKTSYVLGKEWSFIVDLDVWDYDGRTYHKCHIQRTIAKFEGEVAFSSLDVRPIEIEASPEAVHESLLANGKRFYELTVQNRHRFMHYSGPMFQLRKYVDGPAKENAEGRVMIDLTSFAKMNPGYKMGNAKAPVGTFRTPSTDSTSRPPRSRFEENEAIFELATQRSLEETLIYAPAIVYGFSFTLKQWGSFAVSGFSEISFNVNAYDALVMEPDPKQLVYKLVSQYIAKPVDPSPVLQRVDPIGRKGEGCIFLCYGSPGTGKTLTAESVAESMQRPLWSLSASELGGTPAALEKTLVEILEIAATWRAVLLLDEADVFLERRTSMSMQQNQLTGTFLRFLEYYRGVLFLTTNRIATFDNAFRSRISMFLQYSKLSIPQKEQIWTTLLERAGVAGVTAEFVSELATEEFNGREIRNSVRTAQVLAKSNGEILDQSHVRHVTKVLTSSLTTLSNTMKVSSRKEA